MSVKRWKIDTNAGHLLFDREFALVNSSGVALRLSQYPKMCLIRPIINLETMVLEVSAPGRPKLLIDLGKRCTNSMREIKVCGIKCGGNLWGDHDVSAWFTAYLGVQCWLARSQQGKYSAPQHADSNDHKRGGFSNEAPLLLISKTSISSLNQVLKDQGSKLVNPKHFRPNFVVATENGDNTRNPEDLWKLVKFTDNALELSVTGQCARCSMVDIDPDSGMKGKTLRALSEYRRNRGQITFGIFLQISSPSKTLPATQWVVCGQVLEAVSR